MKTPLLVLLCLHFLFGTRSFSQSNYPKQLRAVRGFYIQVSTPIGASQAIALGNSRFYGFFSGDGAFAPSVSRIDSSGTPIWSKTLTLNDTSFTHRSAVFADAKTGTDKHVIAIGNVGVQYNVANGKFQYGTGFVLKLDVSGNVLWSRKFSDSAIASFQPLGVDVCPDSGLVICGRTINSYTTANLVSRSFIARLDKNGNLLWMKRDTAQQSTIAESVVFAGDSGYFMIGTYTTSTLSAPSIWRFNGSGNLLWKKTYCLGTYCGKGYSIAKMTDGLLCLAVGSDLQLLKIGYNGTPVFSKRYLQYFQPWITIEELKPKLKALQSNKFLISNSGQVLQTIVVDAAGQVLWAASSANMADPSDAIQLNNKDFLIIKSEAFLNVMVKQKDSLLFANVGLVVTDSLGSGSAKCYARNTVADSNVTVATNSFLAGFQSIGALTVFQATISNNSFTSLEACMGYPTGIHEQNILHLKVFPNPATKQIYFESDNFDIKNSSFSLSDVHGKLVLKQALEQHEKGYSLYLDNLPAGVYLYRIETAEKQIKVGKLIIAQGD